MEILQQRSLYININLLLLKCVEDIRFSVEEERDIPTTHGGNDFSAIRNSKQTLPLIIFTLGWHTCTVPFCLFFTILCLLFLPSFFKSKPNFILRRIFPGKNFPVKVLLIVPLCCVTIEFNAARNSPWVFPDSYLIRFNEGLILWLRLVVVPF